MVRSSWSWQHLAAASLLLAGAASALPAAEAHVVQLQQREVAHAAPSPWVTVDASGDATTITPTVTTINGAATTLSPPPESLTKTGTYTLAPASAAVTTSTGLPPVATASSSNGDGAFLACTTYQGADAPFCQPKSGSQLKPGNTYYGEPSPYPFQILIPPKSPDLTMSSLRAVTWSETYFSNTSTSLEIQATYHDGSGKGFTSPRMLASRGFYVWDIASDFLTNRDPAVSSLNVSLSLAYFQDLYGNDVEEVPGPTVVVTSTPFEDSGGKGDDKPNVAAIAVPIVVIIVFLALAGLCVWSWRRNGTVPVLGALKRRSTGGGEGYGIRQSRAQRVGGGGGAGGGVPVVGGGADKKAVPSVELTDRDSWSPGTSPSGPGGRNVFREELQRQERER